jgi:hypothetical protein
VIVISMMATLIVSVIYATIWLTKIDDRLYSNAEKISTNSSLITKLTDVVHQQQLVDERVLTLIKRLDDTDNRLRDRLDKRDEWDHRKSKEPGQAQGG